jgi:hypothetical protein
MPMVASETTYEEKKKKNVETGNSETWLRQAGHPEFPKWVSSLW